MIIDVILACSLNFCEFDTLFKKVAYEVNMDYNLLKSIVYVESKFNPFAVSNKKSYGLAQINQYWLKRYKIPKKKIFNPYLNVRLGAEIYLYCYEKTKDKLLALDCYNKGENKKLSRKSTYVKKVLIAYNKF